MTTTKTYTEAEIAEAVELYRDFYGCETVDVSRNCDGDGRVIGFRLSRDTDGGQHGDDERHGVWN